MKNFILILLGCCSLQIFGQSINFSNINSNNILNILSSSTERQVTDNVSRTAVIQVGNNNSADVYDKSKKSDLLIRQTGDFNTTIMTNTNPLLENRQQVNVEGYNNYIDITGNNSNSKEMKINLKTNDKMIFVRHY